MAHVPDLQGNQIAPSQYAVDAQIEQGELSHSVFHLEADAKGMDVLQLERRLLSDELPLVPRLAGSSVACGTHDGLRSS